MQMSGLSEFDVVTINVMSLHASAPRASFDCDVLAIVGRTVALEAVDSATALRLPIDIPDVYLSHGSGRSLRALRGMLINAGVGDLRFLAWEDEPLARRGATRVELELACELVGDDGAPVPGLTVNISAHGAFVASAVQTVVGETLRFTSTMPDGSVVSGDAGVGRVEPGFVALQFRPNSIDLRNAIARTVVDHNRTKLHRQRTAA